MNFETSPSSATTVHNGTAEAPLAAIKNRHQRRLIAYGLLMLLDIAALGIGFLLPHYTRFGYFSQSHGVVMFLVLAPVYLGIALMNHAFAAEVLENAIRGAFRSLRSFMFAATSMLLIAYMIKVGAEFSRVVFFGGLALAPTLLVIFRLAAAKPLLHFLDGSSYSTVVLRDGVPYAAGPGELVVEPVQLGFDPATRDPYLIHAFADRLANADQIIVACPPYRYAQWASLLKGMALKGEIIADDQIDMGVLSLDWHGSHRTMVVATGPLSLSDRIFKRSFDIIFSGVSLLVLAIPMLVVALAIRLESKGSVFFRQDRVGRDNKLFKVLKFRSMFTDRADANGAQLTARNDSRVTRVGDFIRRTSIDELPQLINVLKGEMSMVGPRPHPLLAKAGDQLYWDVDPRYRHRHSIKPGITGLAQVRGFRGNTEREEDLTNRLRADLEYLVDWSIWRDIAIIFRTFSVIRHEDAF